MDNKVIAVDFISSKLFKCTHCGTRLQYPVMKVEGVGSFCGPCITKTDHKNAQIDEDVHSLLLNVQLFCKFRTKGCPAQRFFKEISEHETICDFRDRQCPFSILSRCETEICENLLDHIKDKHNRCVKVDDGNTFKFNFNYNEPSETIEILLFNNEYFIFRVVVKNDKLMFFIYLIGNTWNLNNFYFTLQNRGNDFLTKPKTMFLLHDSKFDENLLENKSVMFDTHSLKTSLGSNIETILTVNLENLKINTNHLLEYIECPVCKDLMKCEISLCKTGHSVCIKCRKNLKRCPICLGPFSLARNYALESLSSSLNIPHRSILPKAQTHNCNICSYSCPFCELQRCEWHGQYKDIIEHLRIDHINCTFYNHQMTRAVSLREEIHDVVCVITLGYVFKVTTRKRREEDKMIIRFEVIGQKSADKYNYRITTNGRLHKRLINYNIPIFSMNTSPEYVTYNISARTLARIVHNSRIVITYGVSQR